MTGIVNSEACTEYPGLIEEALERGWTSWVAHGDNNSTWQVGLEREAEVELVSEGHEHDRGRNRTPARAG